MYSTNNNHSNIFVVYVKHFFMCVLEENEKENDDPISRRLPSPMPVNEGFSKDQTFFLIDLMR